MLQTVQNRLNKNMINQTKEVVFTSFEVDYLNLNHLRDLGVFEASNIFYEDFNITFKVTKFKIEGIDNIFFKLNFKTINDKITFLSFLSTSNRSLSTKDHQKLAELKKGNKYHKLSKKEEVEQYFINKLKYQLKNKNKYQTKIILKNRLNLMNKTLSLLDDKYSVEEALKQVLSEEEYYKHVEFEESKGEKDLDIKTFLYGAKLISLVQKLHE